MTTLGLGQNSIDNRGIQYLANALKTNQVKCYRLATIIYPTMSIGVDTSDAEHREKPHE